MFVPQEECPVNRDLADWLDEKVPESATHDPCSDRWIIVGLLLMLLGVLCTAGAVFAAWNAAS